MRCRWFRRLLLIPLGIAVAPILLWCLVVVVAPTNWAKKHVIAALETSSGRSVDLRQLRVCFGGGVDLDGLKIGAPGSADDPWLDADKVHLDVGVLQLLFGRLEASSLDVDGVRLRVQRRADGSFELADLVRAEQPERRPESTSSSGGTTSLAIRVQRGEVRLIDEPTQSDVLLTDVQGEGTWEEGRTIAGSMSGNVNKGAFQFSGSLNRYPGSPSFEGQLWADRVVLDDGMSFLRYLVPVLAGATPRVQGDLTMDVYLKGDGESKEDLRKSLVGNGRILIDPIALDGTELLAEVEKAVPLPTKSRVGSLRTDFQVREGRITTNRLALNLAKAPLVITGWTDFDGRLDYRMSLEGLADRVPARARQLLSELELDVESLSSLRLSGTVDDLNVSVLGRGARSGSPVDGLLSPTDKQSLRMLGRELQDKFLRR